MAKFISGSSVNAEIEKLLKESENQLVLISPFIQIHERLKYFLNQKLELPNLEILIVFGKNEDNVSKSLSKDDLEFLKRFPNIEIRYNKRLHAKYYSNENSAICWSRRRLGSSVTGISAVPSGSPLVRMNRTPVGRGEAAPPN